jgi:DNA-binding CsgD family transcriptional regulator
MLALLHHAAAADRPASRQTTRSGLDVAGDDVRAHARRLLELATSVETVGQPQQSPGDLLSQRELEVLRLLDSELTGPEIARELYVTLNTLRTHTKRIFTKLDATTRAAAVRLPAKEDCCSPAPDWLRDTPAGGLGHGSLLCSTGRRCAAGVVWVSSGATEMRVRPRSRTLAKRPYRSAWSTT